MSEIILGPSGYEDVQGDASGEVKVNPYGSDTVIFDDQYATSDTLTAKGTTSAAPAAGTAIATISNPGVGTYEIRAVVFITGAVGANEINNAAVFHATTKAFDVPVVNVLNVMQNTQIYPRMTIATGEDIILKTGTSAGTASSVYNGVITATKLH